MPLLKFFAPSNVFLILASIATCAASVSPGVDHQHPIQLPHSYKNFSIGFSLQSSFGAAAIIFESSDGTAETCTRTYEGGYLYQQVMAKLSLKSSQHVAPPYQDDGEYWADQPRQGARTALKSLGLPASYEVGILAQVIRHLRSDMELEFGIKITEAVFTSSHLLALYQDDLEDAAENVGIEYITPDYQFKPIFWETASAYAGHGLGLCENWRDSVKCNEELIQLPKTPVLAVHYSRNALSVSLAEIKTALGTWEPDYRHVENFTLGADSIGGYPSSNKYWTDVQETLLELMNKYPGFRRPETIMVTGDAVDGHFIDFLETTLYDYLETSPTILSSGATVVAVKGAAEIMRRSKLER